MNETNSLSTSSVMDAGVEQEPDYFFADFANNLKDWRRNNGLNEETGEPILQNGVGSDYSNVDHVSPTENQVVDKNFRNETVEELQNILAGKVVKEPEVASPEDLNTPEALTSKENLDKMFASGGEWRVNAKKPSSLRAEVLKPGEAPKEKIIGARSLDKVVIIGSFGAVIRVGEKEYKLASDEVAFTDSQSDVVYISSADRFTDSFIVPNFYIDDDLSPKEKINKRREYNNSVKSYISERSWEARDDSGYVVNKSESAPLEPAIENIRPDQEAMIEKAISEGKISLAVAEIISNPDLVKILKKAAEEKGYEIDKIIFNKATGLAEGAIRKIGEQSFEEVSDKQSDNSEEKVAPAIIDQIDATPTEDVAQTTTDVEEKTEEPSLEQPAEPATVFDEITDASDDGFTIDQVNEDENIVQVQSETGDKKETDAESYQLVDGERQLDIADGQVWTIKNSDEDATIVIDKILLDKDGKIEKIDYIARWKENDEKKEETYSLAGKDKDLLTQFFPAFAEFNERVK